jgi:hypothetical protein
MKIPTLVRKVGGPFIPANAQLASGVGQPRCRASAQEDKSSEQEPNEHPKAPRLAEKHLSGQPVCRR